MTAIIYIAATTFLFAGAALAADFLELFLW